MAAAAGSFMSSRYDVIVAGAGPAGAAAAIACARQGQRVALLEQKPFPRHRPGETLHPGVEGLFRLLGVASQVAARTSLRHCGQTVHWGAGSPRFVSFGGDEDGPWCGYQIWRAHLDAVLMDRAREVGVDVRQPCRAREPVLVAGRVVGVDSDQGELRADFTLDACGSSHWLAARMGLGFERFSPRLIARYGYCTGPCPERQTAPVMASHSSDATGPGWTWTAPLGPELFAWTTLSLAGLCHRASDGEVPPVFRALGARGPVRGADVSWRLVRMLAGAGFYLLGDAAAVLDPASSHGVLRALMSGIVAARSVAIVAGRPVAEAEVSRGYEGWLSSWVRRDVDRLRTLMGELGNVAWCNEG
jgi:flavin-dependent dehydrogenase